MRKLTKTGRSRVRSPSPHNLKQCDASFLDLSTWLPDFPGTIPIPKRVELEQMTYNIPNGYEINQHFPFQDPSKYTHTN
jgi:hypothetical protein